jgi:hypothetical protein
LKRKNILRQSTLAAKVTGSKQGKKTFAVAYVPYSKGLGKNFLFSTLFALQIMSSLLYYGTPVNNFSQHQVPFGESL